MSRPEQLIEIHHIRQLRSLIAENESFLFELRAHQRQLDKILAKVKPVLEGRGLSGTDDGKLSA